MHVILEGIIRVVAGDRRKGDKGKLMEDARGRVTGTANIRANRHREVKAKAKAALQQCQCTRVSDPSCLVA